MKENIMNESKLIFVEGIPGAGKTTTAKKLKEIKTIIFRVY